MRSHLRLSPSPQHRGDSQLEDAAEIDTTSSVSRQHYIDTGRYLTRAETNVIYRDEEAMTALQSDLDDERMREF